MYLSILNYTYLFLHTVLEIGFKSVVYTVEEGDGILEFEVETKNNVQVERPINFQVSHNAGSARSEFFDSMT